MVDNPYRSPPSTNKESVSSDRVTPTREARLIVLAILLFASLIIARLLHEGDLSSLFVASIPIFLLSVIAYYFGLRHGAE